MSELRINPNQQFFPRPDEVAKDIERMKEAKAKEYAKALEKYVPCERNFPDGWRCSKGSLMLLLENPRRVRFGAHCDCWKAWKGVDVDRKSIGAGL